VDKEGSCLLVSGEDFVGGQRLIVDFPSSRGTVCLSSWFVFFPRVEH